LKIIFFLNPKSAFSAFWLPPLDLFPLL